MRAEFSEGKGGRWRWFLRRDDGTVAAQCPVRGFATDRAARQAFGGVRSHFAPAPPKFRRWLLAVAVFIAGMAIGYFVVPDLARQAHAHPGGIANDDCHRDNSADERHWHADGRTRGGVCLEIDGETVRFREIETLPPACRLSIEWLTSGNGDAPLTVVRTRVLDYIAVTCLGAAQDKHRQMHPGFQRLITGGTGI